MQSIFLPPIISGCVIGRPAGMKLVICFGTIIRNETSVSLSSFSSTVTHALISSLAKEKTEIVYKVAKAELPKRKHESVLVSVRRKPQPVLGDASFYMVDSSLSASSPKESFVSVLRDA